VWRRSNEEVLLCIETCPLGEHVLRTTLSTIDWIGFCSLEIQIQSLFTLLYSFGLLQLPPSTDFLFPLRHPGVHEEL